MFSACCGDERHPSNSLALTTKEGKVTVESVDLNEIIGENQVLVEVYYCSLNYKDGQKLSQKAKSYLGYDFSGRVRNAGAATSYHEGDKVYGWTDASIGPFVIVTQDRLAKIPKRVEYKVASCLSFVGWVMYEHFEYGNKEIVELVKKNKILSDTMELITKVQRQKSLEADKDVVTTEILKPVVTEANEKFGGEAIGSAEMKIKDYTEIEEKIKERIGEFGKYHPMDMFEKVREWVEKNSLAFTRLEIAEVVRRKEDMKQVLKLLAYGRVGPYVVDSDVLKHLKGEKVSIEADL